MWALSKDFNALEFVQCHDEGYDSYVEYEMPVPLVAQPIAELETANSFLSGPMQIIIEEISALEARSIYLAVNPESLHDLDALIYDEFYEHLELQDSAPRITFANDSREPLALKLFHVFARNQPVLFWELFILDPREDVEFVLSDVAAAWIFTPLPDSPPSWTLLALWEPIPVPEEDEPSNDQ